MNRVFVSMTVLFFVSLWGACWLVTVVDDWAKPPLVIRAAIICSVSSMLAALAFGGEELK
jgi:hypothetical protein